MVEPGETFIDLPCELNLGRDDDPAPGNIVLTEEGDLTVQFEEEQVSPHTDLNAVWQTIEGTDDRGYNVQIDNATAVQQRNFSLTKISTPSVTISQNSDFAPTDSEEVVIDFDILCFQPQIPPQNQTTRETLKKHSNDEDDWPTINFPDEMEVPYFSTNDCDVFGVSLTDTTDRKDAVKNYEQPIRTAKIRVKQHTQGSLPYRVETAEDIVHQILELSQLVQEVTPRYVRAKVISVDGSPIGDVDAYYELLRSGGIANVGARFVPFPDKVLWGNFHEYIEQAYENYTPHVRDDLRLRQVLGYYVDARNPNRPMEGKMLSVCSAIELFALWHAREDSVSEKTAPKIKHLIDKLGVETEDLAEEVVPNPSELDTPEYFWRRQRNYVAHGDPDVSWDDLINAYGATLVLLKRIIRNQLLGETNSSFEQFYSMSPQSTITFDD